MKSVSYGHVDDQLHSHPKVVDAGNEAMGLWVRALSHCKAYVTLGHVTRATVTCLAGSEDRGRDLARDLVETKLWHVTETGWLFHDWADHQSDDKDVKALRKAATERKRKSRERSRVTTPVTSGVTSGVTGAGQDPVSQRDLARARVPNPKTKTNVETDRPERVGPSVPKGVDPIPGVSDHLDEIAARLTDREHGDGIDWEQECVRLQTESGGRLRAIVGPVQAGKLGTHLRTLAGPHKRQPRELVTILAAHVKAGLAFGWMTERNPTLGYLLRDDGAALCEAVDLAVQWWTKRGPEAPKAPKPHGHEERPVGPAALVGVVPVDRATGLAIIAASRRRQPPPVGDA